MTKENFLPENYKLPTTGGNYTRFEKGNTKIRILSRPLLGWLDWKDKKPYRFAYDNKPEKSFDPERPVKHFWAFKIWNYTTNSVQILEITQATIQRELTSLIQSEDWGIPTEYDLTIKKEGEDLATKYTVIPTPPKPFEHKTKVDVVKVDLDKLLAGLDPFGTEPTSKEKEQTEDSNLIQYPEEEIV